MKRQRTSVIWILEDNDEDYELLEMALANCEYPVRYVRFTRGTELKQHLHENISRVPDLIYADLRMPGLGGLEILELLKSQERFSSVPRLVFSTSANPKDIAAAYQMGANAYHVKLVETPKMLAKLQQTFSYWLGSVEPLRSNESLLRSDATP
ncbi:response regulator [Rhodopirellula sp. JC740]|uniref:Response regulator n=1 Tax=Rhodopirellula halodulae TaxID=2894198 RepID=A0ABS8NBY4_9BACT|nr:response regulator [Rhodopirellula sp. JC740]MCC9641071.1 response regulator [Rhodopirellula sp. JC740]